MPVDTIVAGTSNREATASTAYKRPTKTQKRRAQREQGLLREQHEHNNHVNSFANDIVELGQPDKSVSKPQGKIYNRYVTNIRDAFNDRSDEFLVQISEPKFNQEELLTACQARLTDTDNLINEIRKTLTASIGMESKNLKTLRVNDVSIKLSDVLSDELTKNIKSTFNEEHNSLVSRYLEEYQNFLKDHVVIDDNVIQNHKEIIDTFKKNQETTDQELEKLRMPLKTKLYGLVKRVIKNRLAEKKQTNINTLPFSPIELPDQPDSFDKTLREFVKTRTLQGPSHYTQCLRSGMVAAGEGLFAKPENLIASLSAGALHAIAMHLSEQLKQASSLAPAHSASASAASLTSASSLGPVLTSLGAFAVFSARDFRNGYCSLSNKLLHTETRRELLDPVSEYHRAWMNLAQTQSVTWIEDLTKWIDGESAVSFKKAAEIAVKLNEELDIPPLLDGEMRFINKNIQRPAERDEIKQRFETEKISIKKLADADNQTPTTSDEIAIRCLAQFPDTLPDEVKQLYDLLHREPMLEDKVPIQNYATAFLSKQYEMASSYLSYTAPSPPPTAPPQPSLLSMIQHLVAPNQP